MPRNSARSVSAVAAWILAHGLAVAQDNPPKTDTPKLESPKPAAGAGDLLSYFSAGLAVMRLSTSEVETAEVRAGKVQIADQTEMRIAPWLQAQYIFDGVRTNYLKPGIFVGVGLGSDGSSFDTFGAGVMVSMKRTPWSDKLDKNALNIGVGWYTTKYRTLADDTPVGQPLPTGIESVQYNRRNQSGVMLNISFSI